MEIRVMSRREIEEFKSDKDHIIISITDPNSEKVKIKSKPFAIFSLQFHDIAKSLVNRKDCKDCNGTGIRQEFININNGYCYACTDQFEVKLFNEDDAAQILGFVNMWKYSVDLIIVHCEAGISRSAGVASALSLIYNKEDKHYFKHYLPNMLVYRLILNVYMKEEKLSKHNYKNPMSRYKKRD